MKDLIYIILVIFISAIMTWITRAIPFLVFGNKKLPNVVKYLGNVLPISIMVILVIYCLRNTNFRNISTCIPEILSCGLVILLQKFNMNMYITIILSTFCYMILIRILAI